MVKYRKSSITAKQGMNYVQAIVESAGSLFQRVDQENDLGIDAFIELTHDGQPQCKMVAVQVKSGQSYYNTQGEECLIPLGSHKEYWSNYPLPVIGIVYVPSRKEAYWTDIKSQLKLSESEKSIRFEASQANALNTNSFSTIFVPKLLGKMPDVSIEHALDLISSRKKDESYLGLIVLFNRYRDDTRAWDALIKFFKENDLKNIPPALMYFFAHIPWHPDIWGHGPDISEKTRNHARTLMHTFGRPEILKMLHLIDKENRICRGATGQSVEVLISSVPQYGLALIDIASDSSIDLFVRECAGLILAMHNHDLARKILNKLVDAGSWYSQELIRYLDMYGEVDPYA
ncbi:MAG: DUF4365 domain-containing protein [Planctomycetota bacterium]|jgi:hypothetical protein